MLHLLDGLSLLIYCVPMDFIYDKYITKVTRQEDPLPASVRFGISPRPLVGEAAAESVIIQFHSS